MVGLPPCYSESHTVKTRVIGPCATQSEISSPRTGGEHTNKRAPETRQKWGWGNTGLTTRGKSNVLIHGPIIRVFMIIAEVQVVSYQCCGRIVVTDAYWV